MPGMASGGESVGESWFALKKDEFYVILDSVLTEMTKCDERNNVSGCIELIKLLSDNGPTTNTVNDQLPTCDGNGDTKLADRLNLNQSGNNSSGCIGNSEDKTNGKLPNCNKPPVNCKASGRRFGDNTQLSIRNGVDCRRYLNKGNLPSATCMARRPPGNRDKAASRLQRPVGVFSKDVVHGRKTSLNGKTRDVKASLFHPNRIGTNHGLPNIYFNSMSSNNHNGFNAKMSTVSASRHQRQLAKTHEIRLPNKTKLLCSGPYHDARVSSHRPSTEYRRHQSSHKQMYPGLCVKMKAHNFDRSTVEHSITHTSVGSNAPDDQKSCPETNIIDRHITDPELELRSVTPFQLTPVVDRQFLNTTLKAPNSKWTPVDKTVINNILDDILSSDDSHSPLQTGLQASRNNNDVDRRNDDVHKTTDGFVFLNNVKVENQSDVTTDNTKTANLGNNGVIANVSRLVDVRQFDVSQMSFKWKSQLLWRMRHDKVSQTPLSSLCLT